MDHMQPQSRSVFRKDLYIYIYITNASLRFNPKQAREMAAGECCRGPVCHLPGEDAHTNSSSLQAHVLRRLRFRVVSCFCAYIAVSSLCVCVCVCVDV